MATHQAYLGTLGNNICFAFRLDFKVSPCLPHNTHNWRTEPERLPNGCMQERHLVEVCHGEGSWHGREDLDLFLVQRFLQSGGGAAGRQSMR